MKISVKDLFIDDIRPAPEIARRALALFAVVAIAFGGNREEIAEWLRHEGLSEELSPAEARFIEDLAPSQREVMNATWYSERLIVLLWALNHAPMPKADEQCDTSLFLSILPPYAETSTKAFIRSAKLRSHDELIGTAGLILDLHWEARNAQINDRQPSKRVDLEIIQERHHALNWIIGYEGLPWDEVTTDT